MDKVEQFIRDAVRPPSKLSCWQWLERNVELDATSYIPGKISFDLFPCSKFFFDIAQNRRTRQLVCMVSAQSAKTQNAIMLVLWRIAEAPVAAMWAMAAQDHTEEFAKKRLYPAIDDCEATAALAPKERSGKTKRLIRMDSMNLMLRGSRGRIGLQSDPVGLIICDERREWKLGTIQLIRKRQRTFANSLEISLGTAGTVNDELHQDWEAGSQTFVHWNCPTCQHSQPFRFGQDATPLFPVARTRGGLVWEENDITRPGGVWNWKEVRRTVRYECEHCGERFANTQKFDLLKSAHLYHRNPNALPERVSLHWNALYMPWPECDWADIAVEFLQAVEAMKLGDIEPLKSFVTETLGEPWELRNRQKEGELLDRMGDYSMGERWPVAIGSAQPDTALILTVDRQLLYLIYLVREWRRDGASRLITCGKLPGEAELLEYCNDMKVRGKNVWGDDGGHNTSIWRMACLRNHWHPLKGDAFKYMTVTTGSTERKVVRQGFRETDVDPGVGTTSAGRFSMKMHLWSKDWYRERLHCFFIPGLGPLWEIPRDAPADYLSEVQATYLKQDIDPRGQTRTQWRVEGPCHKGDCEQMQLVAADICGITRKVQKKEEHHG